MTNSISFKAKFIQNGQIKKLNKISGKYISTSVKIIELENKKEDVRIVKQLNDSWKNSKYTDYIYGTLYSSFSHPTPDNNRKVYAITTQTSNLKNLKSANILGLADIETESNSEIVLKYLQIAPETNFDNENRKYKQIGKCFLDYLKVFFNKTIKVNSDIHAIRFYEKNNFKPVSSNKLDYIWHPSELK